MADEELTLSSALSIESSANSSHTSDELLQNRKLIHHLLQTSNQGIQGDLWYLISSDYVNKFFNLPAVSFEDLSTQLGPVDCLSIVDEDGQLYPENEEPVGTYNVNPDIFNYLKTWFGIKGEPVSRYIVMNPQTGENEVERFPLTFHLHQLSKKNSHHNLYSHRQVTAPRKLWISRCQTYNDVISQIRLEILRVPKKSSPPIRIWFIDSPSMATFPFQITLNQFVFEIENKTLIFPTVLNKTIDQINNGSDSHILIEVGEAKSGGLKFPLDIYFDQTDLDLYNSNHLLTSGGHLGLSNLGNTCYMNSALQCLLHIPEVNYFFFFNLFKQELNTTNPLGYHGDVANSFGSLLKLAFDNCKSSSIAPREFKSTIGRYSSMFHGYMQQDSQEFLSWLLDALHEDLNRIHDKPYAEKPELKDDDIGNTQAIIELANTCWEQYKSRNDSAIVDLFTGLYQSTLICPTCSKTSITFDPYNDLTLPLPISKKWYHTFTVIDLSDKKILGEGNIKKLEVELSKTSNYDQLIKYIADFFSVPSSELFLYEIFRESFYSDFQQDYNKNKFLPISDLIRDTDDIYVYYVPHNPDTDIIIPVINSVEDPDKSYNFSELFGIPLFIVLNKETEVTSFGIIRKKLEEVVQVLTNSNIGEEYHKLKINNENFKDKQFYSPHDFPTITREIAIDEEKDSDEYDSDVSLANPYVGADLGFEVKYHNAVSRVLPRHRYGHNQYMNAHSNVERVIHAPIFRPNLKEFIQLGDQLPELKKEYYYYASRPTDPEQDIETPTVNEVQNTPNSSESEKSNEEPFVFVEKLNPSKQNLSHAPDTRTLSLLNLSDEEMEPALNSLLDDNIESESSLAPPTLESLKPSVVNSPEELQESPPIATVNINHPILVTKDTILLCDWNSAIQQEFFAEEYRTWEHPPLIDNPELQKNKARFQRQINSTVSLHDCLRMFSTPEILGEHDLWYCPRCKDHKQATKTIQLWSSGDILTIHLKRFHSARAFSDKIGMLVDFPIEGLDISDYIANPESTGNIYDLVAVDNHYGGLGGGHYTAAAQNFRDGNWYYFDDSTVTKLSEPQKCITPAAYLLFYRRRQSNPDSLLGGDKLNELIYNGRSAYQTSFDEKLSSLETLKKRILTYKYMESQLEQEEKLTQEGEANSEDKGNEASLEDQGTGNAGFSADDELNLYSDEENENEGESDARSGEKVEKDGDETDEQGFHADNSRKQRLISREKTNDKLVQIKSNGRQKTTLSPRLANSDDGDGDNISECNEI
jgi:ubiquitin carboxyl-terminal hydrolase 4/11/15